MTTPSYGVTRQSPDRPPATLEDLVVLVRTQNGPVPDYRAFTSSEAAGGEAERYAAAHHGTLIALPLSTSPPNA